MARTLSGSARRELIDAVRARYRSSERMAKRLILREFAALTGYHRKSAIRVLNGDAGERSTVTRHRRTRVYDDAFCRTLVVLWEASDRVCSKRLRALLPSLVPALERHRLAGAFVHTLTLTDIASTWTECVPLLVREGSLVVETIDQLRAALPFVLQGVDIDNGAEFLNETFVRYCVSHGIELTRSRPYRKNDQAWVEQKNGSVVRRLVGYRHLEGAAAAAILARLYTASRLFVNFFQPSFKLKEKLRVGGRTVKRYDPPQTPCARLLAAPSIPTPVKLRLAETLASLDPLQLLEEIRKAQHLLVCLADDGTGSLPAAQKDDLQRFLMGLSTAWQAGEVRPTHLSRKRSPHDWRTRPDPFETSWPTVFAWFEAAPEQTAKALFRRLQSERPGHFPDYQLRTLQRRVRQWRMQRARRLVFGVHNGATAAGLTSLTHALIDERPSLPRVSRDV